MPCNINRSLGRPKRCRKINFDHKNNFFKPQGTPMTDLEIIELSHEELEALRLKNIENKSQEECACIMGTSQSTFQRILTQAYKKVSRALVGGGAIKISAN